MKWLYTGVVLLTLIPFRGAAQDFPSEMWHEGKVVLLSKDTVKGKIKYDLVNDLIQVETNNVLKTYSARKILFFEIFDVTINSYRQFYSLPYAVQSNYKIPILFEVLYAGRLSLLCREEIVTETVQPYNYSPYYYSPSYSGTRTKLAYKYYFMDEKGNITLYNMKKRDLLSFFPKKQREVEAYIKKNHLKHDLMRDLVRLTAYYNALLGS